MARDVIYYPDDRLKRKSSRVARFDASIRSLIDELIACMYRFNGVGLAAPQIGELKHVLVIDTSWIHGEKNPLVFVNPTLREKRGSASSEEGCLSLPGFTAKVTRASRVAVQALNRDGEPVETQAEGLLAVALQHEMDHLEGVLFIDRVARSVRDLYKKRLTKWEQEFHGDLQARQRLMDQPGAML